MFDGTKIGDQVAKLFAFISVVRRLGDSPLGGADHVTTQLDTTHMQDVQSNAESFAPSSQQVFNGNLHIVIEDLHGRGSFDAHLLLFGVDLDTGAVAFHDESAQDTVGTNLGKNHL